MTRTARITPLLVWATLLSALARPATAGPGDAIGSLMDLESFPSHSRIVLRLDDGVEVGWKAEPTGFEALLKGLNLTDLGAPLGSEKEWAAHFVSELQEQLLRLPEGQRRISGLNVQESSEGVVISGHWRFATGPAAPAVPRMETFEYREHAPGRFIVDFWAKPGPTVSEARVLERQEKERSQRQNNRRELQSRVSRRIASEQAVAAAYRIDSFCREPLKEAQDVFLPFTAVHGRVDYSKYLSGTTPDSQFNYFEPKGGEKDARYVRLALDLYRHGRNALVVRTLDFLDSECPDSPYRGQMRFLRANALLKLGLVPEAQKVLDEVRSLGKGTPEALQAGMFLAAQLTGALPGSTAEPAAGADQPLAAHEAFLWLAQTYPEHRLAWLFHLGAAEALFSIRQTERAAQEYSWVVENGPSAEIKADAAARLGDLYLERRQYEMALAAYSNALRAFKDEAAGLPALFLNRGEALYQMGQYAEARKVYEEYLKRFPSYPDGWRAAFRMGEILGREPGDASRQASRQYFLDTINHFPFSAGSTLARLRLLPCGDHGGYTDEAASRFLDTEARSFDMPDKVNMVHYRDLLILTEARALVSLGREDAAAEMAANEIPRARLEGVKSALQRLFASLFRRRITALLAQGKRYEALDFYQQHLDRFGEKSLATLEGLRNPQTLRNLGAGAPEYLLSLSQAASELDLGQLATNLAERYQEVKRVISEDAAEGRAGARRELASAGSQKEGNSAEVAADKGLSERLEASRKNFAEARGLWVRLPEGKAAIPERLGITQIPSGNTGLHKSQAEQSPAVSYDKIRDLLDQVIPESPWAYEKELVLGLIEERGNRLSEAVDHAAQAQLLLPPEAPDGEKLRIQAWMAGLEDRAGHFETALALYKGLEKDLLKAKAKPGSKEGAPGVSRGPSGFLGRSPKSRLPGREVAEQDAERSSSERRRAENEGVKDDEAEKLGVPAVPSLGTLLLADGVILEKRGRWGDCAEVYSRGMKDGVGGSQMAYSYARALLKRGGAKARQKAVATLEELTKAERAPASPVNKDDFWKQLARETLEDLRAGEKQR